LELGGYGGLGRLFTKCFSTCLRIESGAEMENHQFEKERAKKNMPKVFHFAIVRLQLANSLVFSVLSMFLIRRWHFNVKE
jgi:hypothetical protein